MPELPEVEFAFRCLKRWALHGRVTKVHAPRTRVVHGSLERLVGHVVKRIERRGKQLRIQLDDETRLFSHFGMTGKWVRRPESAEAERWERARIDIHKDGKTNSLRYVDPRMLGRLEVASEDVRPWTKLGPDPLNDGIDAKKLAARLRKTKRTIKEALMDQTLLAGIGNIQATEALWNAKIDPRAKANKIGDAQIRAIVRGIHQSIAYTLRKEKADEISYVEEAGATNPFRIYGRKGEPCPRCKRPLSHLTLGGRGTVYCAKCQQR
jgi:formamidopyrimidine-DNA glycosylase